jgi:hypothetical protein
MAVWADDDDVVCVHPGGPRLVGAGGGARGLRGAVRQRPFPGGARAGAPGAHARCGHAQHARAGGNPLGRGRAHRLRGGHQRLRKTSQGWRLVAHHASPGSTDSPPEISEAEGPRSCTDARLPRTVVAARRPRPDHLAGAAVAPPCRPAACVAARALDHPRRRLHRRRPSARPRPRRAAAGAVPRPGGLLAQPLCAGLRRPARERGWAYAVPHFRGCSGELNLAPRAYHSGDYEEVGWILDRLRERTPEPLRAIGISLGGNALLRWAQEAGTRRHRGARGGRGELADRPGRRRRRHRPRPQPADLCPHVPAHDEAQGAGQAGPAPGAVRPRAAAAPRARSTSSTTCSPRRCTGFATRDDYWRGHRRSRTWTASAYRRWCSTPATTRSCPAPACPRRSGRATTSPVAAAARRPCGLSGGALPGACAHHARGRTRLAGPADARMRQHHAMDDIVSQR